MLVKDAGYRQLIDDRDFVLFDKSMERPGPVSDDADRGHLRANLAYGALCPGLSALGRRGVRRREFPHARLRGTGTAAGVFPDRATRLPLGRMARGLASLAPANGRCDWSPIWPAWRRCCCSGDSAAKSPRRRTVLLAVAMLAASFYPVRHSTEVKPYAIDLLVSLVLLSTGWATGRDIRSSRAWLALFGVTIVGVWCSYAAVFPAASVALFLGAKVFRERSMRLAALWLTYGLILTLSWGIVFVAFAHPQARAAEFLPHLETWRDAFPPLAEPWRLPWWLLDVHTGNMLAYPYGGNNFGSTLTTILVVAGCIRMGRRRAAAALAILAARRVAGRPGRGGPAPLSVRHQHSRHALHGARVLPVEWRGNHGAAAASSLDEPRAA